MNTLPHRGRKERITSAVDVVGDDDDDDNKREVD